MKTVLLCYILSSIQLRKDRVAFDLRKIEPLGSKNVLFDQAGLRQKERAEIVGSGGRFDMDDMVASELEWLNEDKDAIKSLVVQMDASIGQLAKQIREIETQSLRSRKKIESEQHLLFKQIKTLNNLLKNQINIYSSVKNQVSSIELKQSQFMPQIGIGIMAGLMSAITILATAPWITVLMETLNN
jgi:hypothetical protein